MPFNISEYLLTDDLTVLLGLIAATVFLLNNLYKPQPLVHPILLGRQSDVGRARNPGESAIYRNYGTGLMGRFPLRPSQDVHNLVDLVRPEVEAPRTLWSTKITNASLQDRVAALGTGLLRLAQLQPQASTVLILLNDCIEFIIADLALASHSITSYTLSSPTLLPAVLESYPPSAILTHAFLLPQLLEHIYETSEQSVEHTIVVVGEPSAQAMASVASNIKVLKFAEVEREGVKVEKIISPFSNTSDVFSVSFYESEAGLLQGAQLTPENLTAGVAAVRALLPLSHAISPLDTLASSHSLSTAYGRAIAYTAIFEGTSFATLASSELYHREEESVAPDTSDILSVKRKYPIPSPTILFIKPDHLNSLVTAVIKESAKSWLLYSFGWRHKLTGVTEGFVTKESLWDRVVFDGARTKILGEGAATLRGVIVSGGLIEAKTMTPARVALSIPLVNSLSHPLVSGPVLASHAFDLQDFPAPSNGPLTPVAHTGPPSVNIEAKLVGVEDDQVENGANPVGILFVRGPSIAKMANTEGYVDISSEGDDDGWISTGVKAEVQPNGSFQVLSL
ncbi:hypothetical protein K443DRAFT_672626 [Laccaria amethystina LaAM-08-1]|uniref:AMP-dependent synthetase/ligase domain-containing protein n=1 Tax=Laccaria amethystina LaAM-08-1 TaxID=1095629 RepID=A0A0C9Y2Q2_9AGAR|nr:hypothetical protein K443DRAFT_672626 [Laccaria amethystina LaAM-08-1]